MTREEVQNEKIDTQKELLAFEEKHGRPVRISCSSNFSSFYLIKFYHFKQTKLEKDLMRPLYDHYRKIKRLLANNSTVRT
jgi:hypothetical protein